MSWTRQASRGERLQAALLAHGDRSSRIDRAVALASVHGPEVLADVVSAIAEGNAAHAEHAIGWAFVIGGNATFTLQGTRERFTFRVRAGDVKQSGPYAGRPAPFFVSLLTGPDNTTDYAYIGLLDVERGTLRLTKGSRAGADAPSVQAFNWCMSRLRAGASVAPARVYHLGRCGRCGRALTVPSSIISGFGPECSARMEAGEERQS